MTKCWHAQYRAATFSCLLNKIIYAYEAPHTKDLKYFSYIDKYPDFVIEESGFVFGVYFCGNHLED